jgi:hypothetical protein
MSLLFGILASGAFASPALYVDASRDIAVGYSFEGDMVVFSGDLPANSTFYVRLDGDQDGQWGDGPKLPQDVRSHATRDWQISYDFRDASFCTQYILASRKGDPSQVLASAVCGSFVSNGQADVQTSRYAGRILIRYRVPTRELFGILPDAHLQVCVWDGQRTDCQHSPADPFILRRPGIGAT